MGIGVVKTRDPFGHRFQAEAIPSQAMLDVLAQRLVPLPPPWLEEAIPQHRDQATVLDGLVAGLLPPASEQFTVNITRRRPAWVAQVQVVMVMSVPAATHGFDVNQCGATTTQSKLTCNGCGCMPCSGIEPSMVHAGKPIAAALSAHNSTPDCLAGGVSSAIWLF